MKRIFSSTAWALALSLLLVAVPDFVAAAAYKIGPEDVIEIRFWQAPDLNTSARVGLDGNITLDIVGQVQAAGKTIEELQTEVGRLMSRLRSNVSQATVRVLEYKFQHVYVLGAVNDAGRKSYESIPNLWEIILSAGGAAPSGDLTRVTIIRGGDKAGQIEVVNVAKALAEDKLSDLPKIERGDTIEIPRAPGGLPGTALAAQQDKRNEVYVLGAVSAPGRLQFEENTDLLEVIAMAGGFTAEADLKHVRVITKDGNYGQTVEYNLEEYTKKGNTSRYMARKEDTFIIPRKGRGFWGGMERAATVIGIASSAILLYRVFNGDGNSGI